jgi:hypothetical protein
MARGNVSFFVISAVLGAGLAIAALSAAHAARSASPLMRVAGNEMPPPPKLGTVLRYDVRTQFSGIKMTANRSNPKPRGASPSTVSDFENVVTVTSVGRDDHTVQIDAYEGKRLAVRIVQTIPNNPLLQPTKSEGKEREPVKGGIYIQLRPRTMSEKLSVNPAALFPLSVGKAWKSERTESTVLSAPAKPVRSTTTSLCSVIDEPTIKVPAGTFRTFEIACFGSSHPDADNSMTYYAPSLGLVVRRETVTPLGPARSVVTSQLVSVTNPKEK